MAHSLASSIPKVAISTKVQSVSRKGSPDVHVAQDKVRIPLPSNGRRALTYSLVGMALNASMSNEDANAAGRRPPPPPPTEKKDPNMSAVQAKLLASLKRKEAMKDSMAKLRAEGKSVN